jgi:hypothetical protein
MNSILKDEMNYIAFVLGYDLLHDRFINSKYNACDWVYDMCCSIARLFLQSEEYKNPKHSAYEMLEYWLRINKDMIDTYFETGGNE